MHKGVEFEDSPDSSQLNTYSPKTWSSRMADRMVSSGIVKTKQSAMNVIVILAIILFVLAFAIFAVSSTDSDRRPPKNVDLNRDF